MNKRTKGIISLGLAITVASGISGCADSNLGKIEDATSKEKAKYLNTAQQIQEDSPIITNAGEDELFYVQQYLVNAIPGLDESEAYFSLWNARGDFSDSNYFHQVANWLTLNTYLNHEQAILLIQEAIDSCPQNMRKSVTGSLSRA